jgi:chaperonin cofactor prefoldin
MDPVKELEEIKADYEKTYSRLMSEATYKRKMGDSFSERDYREWAERVRKKVESLRMAVNALSALRGGRIEA